ncbi:ABC transporter ATP-binding protein [Pseudonocardia ailaonensis]|uniref:ABC transporter ATP-binding protein n=1 Tax=Pseudonocardia ailaonensis TaxID=367279 RepID=A0ABN2N575_9PSEU
MTSPAPTTVPADTGDDLALALDAVTWGVGGFTIIDSVDLRVRRGEFLSIIGPNGAGKSTLVNLVSGTYRPLSGTISLGSRAITGLPSHRRIRLGLGRTFQTSSLFPSLTVLENARLSAQSSLGGSMNLLRAPGRRDRAHEIAWHRLAEVDLAHRAGDRAADLPYGEKRKLEIAVALCGSPQVLLLDEPTAGVSDGEVDSLIEVIRSVHRTGVTVVMVEHRMDFVVDVSDRISVLQDGRILMTGSPSEVMTDARVLSAYLGPDL